jgi:hypothetical protein
VSDDAGMEPMQDSGDFGIDSQTGLATRYNAHVRGVLGNKCAGQHNLEMVYFEETIVSGYFLAWLSSICVFFSALYLLQEGGGELICSDGGGDLLQPLLEGALGLHGACQL